MVLLMATRFAYMRQFAYVARFNEDVKKIFRSFFNILSTYPIQNSNKIFDL